MGITLFTVVVSVQIIRATRYDISNSEYGIISLTGKITSYPWKLNRAIIPVFIAATAVFSVHAHRTVMTHEILIMPAIAAAIVFTILLLYYGRFELALITFIPVAAAFIWTCAILTYAEISVSEYTAIALILIIPAGCGAGIFVADGLLHEYKTGKHVIAARKTWALLHTFAILAGAAVVVLAGKEGARIPAIVLSTGVAISFLFALSIEVFLFSFFISRRTRKGKFPYTLINLSFTVTAFPIFAIGCFTLSFIGYMLSIAVPVPHRYKQTILHFFIRIFTRFILLIYYTRNIINPQKEDFTKPAVIIANHQSFLDILTVLSLNRKFIMVTSRWVWRSPFFGRVVRKAQFYPIEKGIENGISHFRKVVEEGYSIVVFTEGSRQGDCIIKRFHKGAFFLAEKLSLDIIPLLIHGNGLCMTKGDDFYMKSGRLTMKILKRITPGNTQYGSTYQERTRNIEKFFKAEYDALDQECRTTDNRYFPDKLVKNYLYKGPILEWYLRVKMRMERYYKPFNDLVPYEADVVDIGCGYGFLPYMLTFLSPKRKVTGIDYDADKIRVALHCMSKNDRIHFMHADASTCALPHADVFILSDMLHYLPVEKQRVIIERCAARVKTGGMIIIRDGDASLSDKHRLTRLTEFFSTRFGFNKTKGGLNFTSRDVIRKIIKSCGMEVSIIRNDEHTSNVIYIARKERA
jgi:1-acyl-sn-glycerol-3-phosphate acyltransferase